MSMLGKIRSGSAGGPGPVKKGGDPKPSPPAKRAEENLKKARLSVILVKCEEIFLMMKDLFASPKEKAPEAPKGLPPAPPKDSAAAPNGPPPAAPNTGHAVDLEFRALRSALTDEDNATTSANLISAAHTPEPSVDSSPPKIDSKILTPETPTKGLKPNPVLSDNFTGINNLDLERLEAGSHPGESNIRLAAGSVTMTSDRDYTFLSKGGCAAGGAVARDPETPIFREWSPTQTTSKYKELLSKAREGTLEGKANDREPGEQGYKKLDDNSRGNAMTLLAEHDCDWFKMLDEAKLPEGGPDEAGIWDVRVLEMEITFQLQAEIETQFSNISEAEMCQKMNQGMMEIFGKEAGSVFDTNYYSGHAVLTEGLDINSDVEKQDWANTNITMGALKVAVHTPSGDDGKADFEGRCEKMAGGKPIPESGAKRDRYDLLVKAWELKEERDTNIQTESGIILEKLLSRADADSKFSVSESIRPDFEELKDLLAGDTSIDAIKENPKFESLLKSPEIEMMAMNRLYEKEMAKTEEVSLQKNTIEDEINDLQEELASETLNPGDTQKVKAELAEHKEQHARLTKELAQSNMSQLMYANEPYFAHGTILHVVAGVQMNKGDMGAAKETYPLLDTQASYDSSVIENGGDGSVKEFNHLKHEGKGHKFFFKGSKYIYRQANAMTAGLKKKKDVPDSDKAKFQQFEDTSKALLKIRGGSMEPEVEALASELNTFSALSNAGDKKTFLMKIPKQNRQKFIELAKEHKACKGDEHKTKELCASDKFTKICTMTAKTPDDTSKMKACTAVLLNDFSNAELGMEQGDIDNIQQIIEKEGDLSADEMKTLKTVSTTLGDKLNAKAENLSDRYFALTVN